MAKNMYLLRLFLLTALCLAAGVSGGVLMEGSQGSGEAFDDLVLDTPDDQALRQRLLVVAAAEIGVVVRSGRNDGERVGQYLAYCGLSEGHEWCAAFVSWCFGQLGLPEPRNPWSPALFPKARRLAQVSEARPADVFGLYSPEKARITHAGLVEQWHGPYLITIEGNSRNRVERRRRHQATVHTVVDWISEKGGRR